MLSEQKREYHNGFTVLVDCKRLVFQQQEGKQVHLKRQYSVLKMKIGAHTSLNRIDSTSVAHSFIRRVENV